MRLTNSEVLERLSLWPERKKLDFAVMDLGCGAVSISRSHCPMGVLCGTGALESREGLDTERRGVMRSVSYLTQSGNIEKSSKFEEVGRGVIIPVGAASEILIPWARVLEIWDARGKIPREIGQ